MKQDENHILLFSQLSRFLDRFPLRLKRLSISFVCPIYTWDPKRKWLRNGVWLTVLTPASLCCPQQNPALDTLSKSFVSLGWHGTRLISAAGGLRTLGWLMRNSSSKQLWTGSSEHRWDELKDSDSVLSHTRARTHTRGRFTATLTVFLDHLHQGSSMAERRGIREQSEDDLPVYLARPGTADQVPRQKYGGLFCSVEDAFASKTLDFDALSVGQRGSRTPRSARRETRRDAAASPRSDRTGSPGAESPADPQDQRKSPQDEIPDAGEVTHSQTEKVRKSSACAEGIWHTVTMVTIQGIENVLQKKGIKIQWPKSFLTSTDRYDNEPAQLTEFF